MADTCGGAHYLPSEGGIMVSRLAKAALLFIAVNYGLLVPSKVKIQ